MKLNFPPNNFWVVLPGHNDLLPKTTGSMDIELHTPEPHNGCAYAFPARLQLLIAVHIRFYSKFLDFYSQMHSESTINWVRAQYMPASQL